MTEERIKQAAQTIHSTNASFAGKLTITEGVLRTVAAEAREEGIEDFYAYLIKIHPASLEQIANLMNELLEKKNV